MPPRPALLCIMDGWGHRPATPNNAILAARTPNFDRMVATCPQGLIDASESFVGLPKGQMGNSEVGHMNLGAGRVAVPELPRIDNAIEDGSLARHPILIVTGEHDPRHPRAVDEATARYLGAEFVWLPDIGIAGNGHMLMIEDNSDAIARLILDWLDAKGL